MSYQPPSQPGGEPTQPAGGYTPPPPPSGSGEYTPPSAYGGGYSGQASAPETPGGGPGLNFGALMQSYINAVTRPNAGTYEAEIPNASWVKVLIGVAVVAVLATILGFLGLGAATAEFDNQIAEMRRQATPGSDIVIQWLEGIRGFVSFLALSALITTFIGFFLGTGIQFMSARSLGGQGSDFMTQSYLSSLSYVPLHVAASAVSLVPFIGGLVSLALSIYQIVCVGYSLQASQRMQPGRAMLAAFVPAILTLLLTCIGCVVLFFVIAGAVGNTNP